MGRKITLAVCSLNQWVLDFENNVGRIIEAIKKAKEKKAKYLLCPELCICGYGCSDHFFEGDTILHSFEALAKLLVVEETKGMICNVGMPVIHKNVRYNCSILFMYKRILLIRPKKDMANDECYRELRWFTPWKKHAFVEEHFLPRIIQAVTGQETVSFGDGVISTQDTCIGSEICEELWSPRSSMVNQSLDGIEIVANSSGSHHELGKSFVRVDLVKETTMRLGGIYLFANVHGCDGDRLYYDGGCMIAMNGEILVQGSQFTLNEVEVLTAVIDLEDVRTYRTSISSRSIQSALENTVFPRIIVKDFSLSPNNIHENIALPTIQPIKWKYFTKNEEIELGPACWLWDYLRRSTMSGFFLPLSGGLDSASVACLVYSMCNQVHLSISQGNKTTLNELQRVINDNSFVPTSPKQIYKEVITTCYMGTENSTSETRQRAYNLAHALGADESSHISANIDLVIKAFIQLFSVTTGVIIKFKAFGGSHLENIALQNIQARTRMVFAYLLAGILPWIRKKPRGLLVLGSSNVDESLTGYFTKYDCSSADLNPIGSISKNDLKSFLKHCHDKFGLDPLKDILKAVPTAELEPLKDGCLAQTDEEDMGITYTELSTFGTLRKVNRCGPYSMFCKLVHTWKEDHTPREVSEKVKHFFRKYGINRHKMTTLTPSYHAAGYSPDDNRFDLRPFLYNICWTWQFQAIDEAVEVLENSSDSSDID